LSEVVEIPVFRRLAGRFSSVTNFTLPSKVDAGVEVPFAVAGHLDSVPSPDWPNFAVGFWYFEGPMAEITLIMDGKTFTLRPNTGVAKYVSPRPSPCASISMDCKIKSLNAGSYKFAALTGYVSDSTFYYDDRVDKAVESVAPGWPWWLLPLGAGLGVLAIVGGIIYYEERRRSEMLMLMMR
jgi:hypothetical protein